MIKKILLITSLFLISSNVLANDISAAKEFINNFGNNVIKIAGDDSVTLEERRNRLVQLIDDVVDSEWVAKFVLAKNYRTASQTQKDRFQSLYRDFMIHTYAPSFTGYNGENFEVIDVAQKGSYFMVKCFFIPKEGPNVNLSFRLKKNDDGVSFSILDAVAEGVSLIETQRSEFGSVISVKGMDGFLMDLELRVKSLKGSK